MRREERKKAKELEEEKLIRIEARRLRSWDKVRLEGKRKKRLEKGKVGSEVVSSSSEEGDDGKSYQTSKINFKKNKDNKNVYGKVPLIYGH